MSRAKKGSSSARRESASNRRGGLIRWLVGPGLPVALLLVIAGIFGGAWRWAWLRVGPRELASKSYFLSPENVEITPRPKWISRDIRPQVFSDPSLEGPLSITDDHLLPRIRAAFALHPWVARVGVVRKYHPARVTVELVYRRPVCMVDVGGDLVPVDVEGMVLPSEDFSPVEPSRYPRLVGAENAPARRVGVAWADDRVLGGAEIAGELIDVWEKLGLNRIEAVQPPATGIRDAPTFNLLTRNETRIIWGHAPTSELAGGIPAKEKIARLERYFAEHGTLDGQPRSVILDLTRPASIQPAEANHL